MQYRPPAFFSTLLVEAPVYGHGTRASQETLAVSVDGVAICWAKDELLDLHRSIPRSDVYTGDVLRVSSEGEILGFEG